MHTKVGDGLSTLSNTQLVQFALAGGPHGRRAWNALVEANARAVWKALWSYRLSDSDREDAFQSTWLNAIEHLHQLREPATIHVWLMTIARHEAERVSRKSAKLVPVEEPPERDVTHPIDSDDLESVQRIDIAREALKRLGDDCRELLRLLTIEELTYREIEEIMGWQSGGTAIRRSRCLERVRKTPEVAAYLRALGGSIDHGSTAS